ncbi:MAG: PP0621 family protein [Gammaproteobacteria bacterium]
MNVLRLLLLLAAAWLIWRIVRQVRAQLARQSPPPADAYEPMSQCAKCGTHLPARSLNSAGVCGRCGE